MDRPNTVEIKKWLLDRGLTQSAVARDLGVTLEEVNGWINCRKNSCVVASWFRENGLPEMFIGAMRWTSPRKKSAREAA